MRILIVSATYKEIEKFLSALPDREIIIPNRLERKTLSIGVVDILITGVGMVFTAYYMGKVLSNQSYNFAINAGVAGAFDRQLELGQIVNVTEDYFSELGAENADEFISISELNLLGEFDYPYNRRGIENYFTTENRIINNLKKVSGITVNTVHGNEKTIYNQKNLYFSKFQKEVQIETMEGASFLFACIQSAVPCIQVRAISNYVEKRNKENWKLETAIGNLNDKLIEVVNDFVPF